MTWTTPKTWVTGEPLTAGDLNTHLRDNLNALKTPPGDAYIANEASNYTTTSTAFVSVDATNLALTITTAGGDALVAFSGAVSNNTAGQAVYFDVDLDGVRQAGNDGINVLTSAAANSIGNAAFAWLVTGLAAGSHTFKLQWKVSGGTGTLYAGAGTGGADIHPQFWVREI